MLSVLICLSCAEDDGGSIPLELIVADFLATVNENPMNGELLGGIQASTNRGTIVFTLDSMSPGSALAISASTGELSVADSVLFDFEQYPVITATVVVQVEDVVETADVIITLTDVDDRIRIGQLTGHAWKSIGLQNGLDTDYTNYDFTDDGDVFAAFSDYNTSNSGLSVYQFSKGSWAPVGNLGITDNFVVNTKITVDGTTPYVSYVTENNQAERYPAVVTFDGTSWKKLGVALDDEYVDSDDTYITASNDIVYLSYYSDDEEKVKYSKFENDQWTAISPANNNLPFGEMLAVDGALYVLSSRSAVGNSTVFLKKYENNVETDVASETLNTLIGALSGPYFFDDNFYMCVVERVGESGGPLGIYRLNGNGWDKIATSGFDQGVYEARLAYHNGFLYCLYSSDDYNGELTLFEYADDQWTRIGPASFGLQAYSYGLGFIENKPVAVFSDEDDNLYVYRYQAD